MAYDEELAARLRARLGRRKDVRERAMFGGLAFLLGGHMVCGVVGDRLVLRLGAEGAVKALQRRHARPMDFTGRPMASMIYVDAPGYRREADLRRWIDDAMRFAKTLPPKSV